MSCKVIYGRSYCTDCKHILKLQDMIPIISFLRLKGKCRYCYSKYPLYNFISECIGFILFVVIFLYFNYFFINAFS